MGKIKKLPEELISKIAAGEIIERPAYAVKELVENSIDAKAKNITIEIEDSGLKKIVITDDGSGMNKEDLLQSIKSHTTSKIYTEDQLSSIKTLGFRGEALSSIASISDITIRSKERRAHIGNEISSIHGLGVVRPVGMPVGTQVIIENIFSKVPVRRKFLKTKETEYRHILDVVSSFTISSNLNIKFINNKKNIFIIRTNQSIEDKLHLIFGENITSNLLPFKYQESFVKIYGFLGKPQISSATSNKFYLYVNKRRVYDQMILSAVKEGYSNLIEQRTFPIALLFLELPYELVDVNIHPQKDKIKFLDQNSIYNAFEKGTKTVLEKNNLTFFNVSWKQRGTATEIAKALKSKVKKSSIGKLGLPKKNSEIIQIHNLYLVTETEKGILLIDRHAAHEAILYRKFVEEFNSLAKKKKLLS